MPNPPKLNPQRGDRGRGIVHLPAEGRQGEPPMWPLASDATEQERDAWWQLWRTPQAVMWERLGWTRTVARYCRFMVEAEEPGAAAALLAAVTAMEDRLGLTPKAMRLLLWQVTSDEVGEQREKPASSVRGRLRAVDSA